MDKARSLRSEKAQLVKSSDIRLSGGIVVYCILTGDSGEADQ